MPKGSTIYVHLTDEQDTHLQSLELSPNINHKVRLRASVYRLSNQGWDIPRLSRHFKRHKTSIKKDFMRWEEFGIQGMCDGVTTGRPRRLSPEIQAWVKEQLSQERVWNANLLCEAIAKQFSIQITIGPMRLYLLEMGYRWKRARYSSGKTPDPTIKADHRASLETLKRGHWIRN
jgi:transposase